jgi:hypothetical protein
MASDTRLLGSQKREVLLVLQGAGIDPAEFRWETQTDNYHVQGWPVTSEISVLIHSGSGYYFKFGAVRDVWSPGGGQRIDTREHGRLFHFQLESFNEWLRHLTRELNTPDPWSVVYQHKALAEAAASAQLENDLFTPEEQRYIGPQLEQLKQLVLASQEFQVEQKDFIEQRFRYLEQSSVRMGRKDWLNNTIGVFFTVIVGVLWRRMLQKSYSGALLWHWSRYSTT